MAARRYDFVAIGGGNAGLTAAAAVAAAGRRVALVDRGPIGGLRSLNGCNPKKVLVRATEVLDEIRHAGEHGIEVGTPRVDWSRVIDRKERFTRPVTAAAERSLAEAGIDHVRGAPRFVGRHELAVGDERLEAGALCVATGSTPRRLTFPGAELVRTTDDILAPDAGEQIHVFALALHFGIPADELRRSVCGSPTLGSAIPYALG